jgi:hypothetical protein
VTGSCHIVRANGKTILLDCGLFQGEREETDEKNRRLPFLVAEGWRALSAVLRTSRRVIGAAHSRRLLAPNA